MLLCLTDFKMFFGDTLNEKFEWSKYSTIHIVHEKKCICNFYFAKSGLINRDTFYIFT